MWLGLSLAVLYDPHGIIWHVRLLPHLEAWSDSWVIRAQTSGRVISQAGTSADAPEVGLEALQALLGVWEGANLLSRQLELPCSETHLECWEINVCIFTYSNVWNCFMHIWMCGTVDTQVLHLRLKSYPDEIHRNLTILLFIWVQV